MDDSTFSGSLSKRCVKPMRLKNESEWEFMIRRVKEKFESMTEQEKEEVWKKHRESRVRANLSTGDPRLINGND